MGLTNSVSRYNLADMARQIQNGDAEPNKIDDSVNSDMKDHKGNAKAVTPNRPEDKSKDSVKLGVLEDLIPGGEGDNLTVQDVDQQELLKGIKVELEHTYNKDIAKEIALDHLAEDPKYYSKLATIHQEGKRMKLKEAKDDHEFIPGCVVKYKLEGEEKWTSQRVRLVNEDGSLTLDNGYVLKTKDAHYNIVSEGKLPLLKEMIGLMGISTGNPAVGSPGRTGSIGEHHLNESGTVDILKAAGADITQFLYKVIIPKSKGYVHNEKDAAALLIDALKIRYRIG